MNPHVYIIRIKNKSIMKYILANAGKNIKKHIFQATIIYILISSNKMVMSFNYRDQIWWPVYIIIGNLDTKTQQS